MQIPFVGPTYAGRSKNISASRSVNFFLEISNPESVVALIGSPGTSLWKRVSDSPIRALYKFGDYLFAVSGSGFYRIDKNKTATLIGNLNTRTGTVTIEDNGIAAYGVGGNQLTILDDIYGYVYDYLSNTIIQHPSENFPTPVKTVAYMDGYFIVSSGNMGITTSELYDGITYNGLAIAAAIATPDNIQKVVNLHQQLFIIKEYATEVWYNTGTATIDGSPFARVNGAVMDFGTMAPKSVARGNNALYFLAAQRMNSGSGAFVGVVELNGYTPEVITPVSIIHEMSKYTLTDAEAYCYADEGHMFYVLTFPTDNVTFVYDSSSKMWHERSTYTKKDQVSFDVSGTPIINSSLPITQNRHLSSCYVNYNGVHLVGDYRTGNIYEMSTEYYTDNGETIVSSRTSQIVSDKNDAKNIFISKMQVTGETGVGDTSVFNNTNAPGIKADGSRKADGTWKAGSFVVTESVGSNPEAFLSWSNDSGHSWSNEYPCSMGKTGEYGARMVWRRIGFAHDRVYRLRISSPVKKVITGAVIEGGL